MGFVVLLCCTISCNKSETIKSYPEQTENKRIGDEIQKVSITFSEITGIPLNDISYDENKDVLKVRGTSIEQTFESILKIDSSYNR